jgi:epoxide hydrolase 4
MDDEAPTAAPDRAAEMACPDGEPRIDVPLDHRFVRANGVRFHVVEAGRGPLVLLLHGFPEFWYGWRHQIGALAGRFRVVAPDLRGYHLSEKPADGYDFATLARDVAELVPALGEERAHVVGHDWGGVVAWGAAANHPARVERLTILNAPHPGAYLREIRRNPRQMARSWYIGVFLVPGLAERLLGARRGALLTRMFRDTLIHQEAMSDAEIGQYRRAAGRPGALPAMLAYYRSLRRSLPQEREAGERRIAAETLVIWGMRDAALVPELTEGLERWAPNVRVERIPDAGHWVQHERPAVVNRLLLDFLGGG